MQAVATPARIDARRLYRKISWRLIPYIFLLYILCYIDRVNIGFAAVEFTRDLNLSNTAFGLGAALYFLGQLSFDLPSNLLLQKVGARRWIARIMISWGIVASAMMFVTGAHSFYALRLLLGICEAGFFPGMILYLTYWFPSAERARAIAKFMTATSIAGVVGAELARLLLKLDGRGGLYGWQWLFLLEGVPSILLGISVLFVLNDGPQDAAWLSEDEKRWLEAELQRDRDRSGATARHNLTDAFRMPMVWVLAAIFMISQVGVYTVNIWMPKMLTAMLHTAGQASTALASIRVDRYAALPYLAAAICTVLVGLSSDRTGERRRHIAACLLLAACGFAWAAFAHTFVAALLAFTFAAIGYWSMMGPFWALPTRVLGGRAAAGAVGIITMVGSCGGFLGPALTGRLRDTTHNFTAGLLVIGGLALVAAGLCALLKERSATSSGT